MNRKQNIQTTNDRFKLKFHIMAPFGWINDPNGLSFFKGYYHIFYQYHPYSAQWGPMHWGHTRSKDLIHWEDLGIALSPGDSEDEDGCFSGSAIVKDDKLYLMYTGHTLMDKNNPDSYRQNQNLAVSTDGIHFKKSTQNPVIALPPADNASDFRDPKIWQHNDKWYVVIGSKSNDGLGRVLLYRSDNLTDWQYLGPLAKATSANTEGFVWECPDFFSLNESDILIFSPQGIQPVGLKYRNLFQTGYFIGSFDWHTNNYKLTNEQFTELDHGHDFYAPQTLLAPDGRRILIGWMNMWESDMPEQEDGWAGALTFPRELQLRKNKLYMTPIKELNDLRKKMIVDKKESTVTTNVINLPTKNIEYWAHFKQNDTVAIQLMCNNTILLSLNIDPITQKVTLQKYNDPFIREAQIDIDQIIDVHILIDTSSCEIFVNNGEAVFTERIYGENDFHIKTFSDSNDYCLQVYELATN
ncbi:glycoside hydrolase family 32 protein [Leuconostoc inhae]|uniref:glycoside hydrolase family 32 protein n=1 Tax=Leuconostoc inhae TaxID=178001 RepID=UPI001C7D2740|nr:sucrose-6-phosphate hydrolase [Leuconostoc inhae]